MNWSGGLIDLQMAPGGDETLLVGNFQPMNGGKLRLEANFAAPHGTGDQTSFGTGSADTIEVAAGGLVTPAGVTQVDLLFTGVPVLNLLGTSGSLALVRSAAPALPDPGLGGISTLVPSLHYAFVADPSLKKLKFVLQDDGAGGVYLRWAPVPCCAGHGSTGARKLRRNRDGRFGRRRIPLDRGANMDAARAG